MIDKEGDKHVLQVRDVRKINDAPIFQSEFLSSVGQAILVVEQLQKIIQRKERFAVEGEDHAYDFESFARAIWHYEELIEATNDPEKIKEYQEEINKIKEEEQAHMKGLGLI